MTLPCLSNFSFLCKNDLTDLSFLTCTCRTSPFSAALEMLLACCRPTLRTEKERITSEIPKPNKLNLGPWLWRNSCEFMGAFHKPALPKKTVLEGLAISLWPCLFPALLKGVQSRLASQPSRILSGGPAKPFWQQDEVTGPPPLASFCFWSRLPSFSREYFLPEK